MWTTPERATFAFLPLSLARYPGLDINIKQDEGTRGIHTHYIYIQRDCHLTDPTSAVLSSVVASSVVDIPNTAGQMAWECMSIRVAEQILNCPLGSRLIDEVPLKRQLLSQVFVSDLWIGLVRVQ